MVSIDEELKAAKAALDTLSTGNPNIATLRKAIGIARRARVTGLSSEAPLNDARYTVGIALPDLIRAHENDPSPQPQQKIDKAKRAVEAWMRHLPRRG